MVKLEKAVERNTGGLLYSKKVIEHEKKMQDEELRQSLMDCVCGTETNGKIPEAVG